MMHSNYKFRALLVLTGLFYIGNNCYCQDKNIDKGLYKAATIPDSLKEGANSVLRYGMEDVVIKGPGREVDKIHAIVTILNEKANDEAEIVLPYNKKFSSVSSFEMNVYDADGKAIKKYHKSDLYEHAAEDDETLVTDDKVLVIRHVVASYPSTIEIICEIDNNSFIDLGNWHIQKEEQSIQNSAYHLTINSNSGFRYLNKNTVIKPQVTKADANDSYLWNVTNLKAVKLEAGALSWKVLPRVYFAANDFEYYGIPGSISTWQDYGKWIQKLNADVNTLSPQRVEEIKQMTAKLSTDKEKAKYLYEYMEHNMRYVSIQLGIGGLKPFPATFVDQKKYGDCKALANYMVALLKAVNIPAYYAVVKSGPNEEPADASFPADPFDHIIVCVPFKGDTTWLECTNSNQPFGKLGAFTENRNALLITEDGGKLVNTPRSSMQDNQFNGQVHLVLDAEGGAKAEIKISGTGTYRDDYIGMESLKFDQQKELFIRLLKLKQPIVFNFKPSADKDGVKDVNINLEFDKFYDVKSGDKQFYHPAVFDVCAFTVPIEEKRKTDFYFDTPMQKSCVTTIDLPAGFEVESLPANQTLKFDYGNYEAGYVYDATKNQVIATAKFNITSNFIPAAKYTELQQYLDAVAKAQNKKLIIKRKA